MPTILADVRYAWRMLRRRPLSTAAAILTLALGIGGTTAMFSVVDAVLLRALPYRNPDRLAAIWATSSQGRGGFSPGDFVDVRRETRAFDDLAAIVNASMSLTGGETPEQVRVQSVSGSFFPLLGIDPVAGRLFDAKDDENGPFDRVVLGERLWRNRYGARTDLERLQVVLGGRPMEVVGVAPAAFRFERPADLWLLGYRGVPRGSTAAAGTTTNRDIHVLQVIGALAQGVSLPVAQAELDAQAARLARAFPATNTGTGIAIEPLANALVGDTSRVLVVLLAAVVTLLVIASVNVANLMLVRITQRHVELTMRSALGAAPGRVVRLILIETIVLAAIGGLLGVAVAYWGVTALTHLAPPNLPRFDEVTVDARVLAAGLGLTLITGCGVGVWPAWRAARASLTPSLASGDRASSPRDRRRGQFLLVGAELALAQILLVGAGLLVTSFQRLTAVDPGISVDRLITVDVSLDPNKYGRSPDRKLAFHEAVLQEIAGTAGIDTAAMALTRPLSAAINRGVWIEGRPEPRPGERQTMSFGAVSEEYFDLLAMRIRLGRGLTIHDGSESEPVVVVNEAFVRQYLAGGDPLTRRIGFGDRSGGNYWRRVVGVVSDAKERLAAPAQPTAYLSFRQDTERWNFASYVMRTSLPPDTLSRSVQQAVLRVDPDQPISRVRTLAESVAQAVAVERFTATLSGAFAVLALALAAVGAFGVMSHVVGTRRRELGVRLAVGAQARDIVWLVGADCLRIVGFASIAGLAGAAIAGRSIATLLFGVTPGDPATLAASAAILGGTALVATYLPVRRALASNPIASLRDS
jgi:putative ABC transport system permease protein